MRLMASLLSLGRYPTRRYTAHPPRRRFGPSTLLHWSIFSRSWEKVVYVDTEPDIQLRPHCARTLRAQGRRKVKQTIVDPIARSFVVKSVFSAPYSVHCHRFWEQ